MLTLVAYVIHTGPSSSEGLTVVEYYSAHGTATLWGAALFGVATTRFIWFAETFAERMPCRAGGVAGAAAIVTLYLVAVGCWRVLAEIYGGVDLANVPNEGYGNAHVLYVVGIGAGHMGNFAAAAYVGASAAAMLASTPSWRALGWLGIGITALRLISALVALASSSPWSRRRRHPRLPGVPCLGVRCERDAGRGDATRHSVHSPGSRIVGRLSVGVREVLPTART